MPKFRFRLIGRALGLVIALVVAGCEDYSGPGRKFVAEKQSLFAEGQECSLSEFYHAVDENKEISVIHPPERTLKKILEKYLSETKESTNECTMSVVVNRLQFGGRIWVSIVVGISEWQAGACAARLGSASIVGNLPHGLAGTSRSKTPPIPVTEEMVRNASLRFCTNF